MTFFIYLYFLFFFLPFSFLQFFGVKLFSLKSSNSCLFQISFFLLLIIYFQHFISKKWGCHKFWSLILKSCFNTDACMLDYGLAKNVRDMWKNIGRDWDNLAYVTSHNLLQEVNLMNIMMRHMWDHKVAPVLVYGERIYECYGKKLMWDPESCPSFVHGEKFWIWNWLPKCFIFPSLAFG